MPEGEGKACEGRRHGFIGPTKRGQWCICGKVENQGLIGFNYASMLFPDNLFEPKPIEAGEEGGRAK